MLKVEDVTYVYRGTEEGIRGVCIDVPQEHVFAILGRSGAGKTTLLQCLGRFLQPQEGCITIDGEDIRSLDEVAFRRRLGLVFQRLNLFPHLTVRENIELAPVKALKRDRDEVRPEGEEMLDRFGIAELAEKYPAEISGGQAQRVAICRSMMLKPNYLLLDEPTAALDVQTTREFTAFLLDLRADTTFIVVTHDMAFARETATHGVLMREGRITASGVVQQILDEMDTADNA